MYGLGDRGAAYVQRSRSAGDLSLGDRRDRSDRGHRDQVLHTPVDWWRSRTTGVDFAITAVAATKWDGVGAVKVASARVPQPGGPAHSSTVLRSEP
ncbi:hypothetical protein GCM10010234_13310 [Streptomyces hawaiiensis]